MKEIILFRNFLLAFVDTIILWVNLTLFKEDYSNYKAYGYILADCHLIGTQGNLSCIQIIC